ncbi:MAG: tRNA adenosine(34) deaminase TadA [bacterium]
MDELLYMQLALKEASIAYQKGEVPIGAIVVNQSGEVIAGAHNQVEELNDPTAHAEILAIRKAAYKIKNWRLQECTIFCTVEPCVMCAGCIIQARIKKLVYASEDNKFGAVKSLYNILEDQRLNHYVEVDAGLFKDKSVNLLKSFFSEVRNKKKAKRL